MMTIYSAILTVALGCLGPLESGPEADSTPILRQPTPLKTSSIEFEPWDATPWPDLTGQALRNQEQGIADWVIALSGRQSATRAPVVPFRTRFLHVGGGLPRQDLIHIGTVLDRSVQRMHTLMQRPVEEAAFAGRLGLVLVPDRDAFVLLLASEFDVYVPSDTAAVLQVDGPRTIAIVDASAPRGHIDHQLDRVVTHAYLHALDSPRRLPAWANEGLATAIAWSSVDPDSRRGRTDAIEDVRSGVPLGTLLEMKYADGSWSADPKEEARGGLLMERLLDDRPEQLSAWIRAIKRGEPWREAFVTAFGDTPESMVEWVTTYFKVND